MKKLYEEQSIRSIANAIRAKNGSTNSYKVGQMASAIQMLQASNAQPYDILKPGFDAVDGVDWVKPDEWPDIESLPLPTDGTSCVYFLIDNTCDADCFNYVRFRFEGSGKTHTFEIGHMQDGQFVSDESYSGTGSWDTDCILIDKTYCDYPIVKCSTNGTRLVKQTPPNYTASTSPTGLAISSTYTDIMRNIMVYGTIPTITSLTGVSGNSPSIGGRFTRKIKLINCDNVTQFAYAFQNGYVTDSIEIQSTNQIKPTTLTSTFSYCSRLKNLDLSNFDVSNCTSFSNTFYGCNSLQDLDISNWIVSSKCTNLSGMFYACKSLSFNGMQLSSWNTSNVTNFSNVFYSCFQIKTLDVSNWDISKATTTSAMFSECRCLQSLSFPNMQMSKLTNSSQMFTNCLNLCGQIDLSNINPTNLNVTYNMFSNCNSISKIKLGKTKIVVTSTSTSTSSSVSGMFNGCWSLKTIDWDMSDCDFSVCGNLSSFYANCYNLQGTIDWSWYTGSANVTSFTPWNGCRKITQIKLPSVVNLPKCTSLAKTYNDMRSIKKIDASCLVTGTITSLQSMFANCYNVQQIIMPNIDCSNVTTMTSMFANCYALKEVPTALKSINIPKCTTLANLFQCCFNLKKIDLSEWTNVKATTIVYICNDCRSLTYVDLSSFNGVNITANQTSSFASSANIIYANLGSYTISGTFTFPNYGSVVELYMPYMNASFTINYMYSLSDASRQRVVDCLKQTTTAKTITLGTTARQYSKQQIATIISKGWTIA